MPGSAMKSASGEILIFCLTLLIAFGGKVTAEPISGPDVRLPTGTIRFAISPSLFAEKPPSLSAVRDPIGVVERAAERWRAVSALRIDFQRTKALSVSPSGPRGDRISLITAAATAENLALFPEGEKSPPAITRVFFNNLGHITEADIALNPFVRFSDTAGDGIDLEAVLTHEIGHAIGLEHSAAPTSIMNPAFYSVTAGFSGAVRLAEMDKSAARGKYGPAGDSTTECCSAIIGTIAATSGQKLEADIWVEDAFGRLIAYTRSSSEGVFALRGLEVGTYSVYAQAPEAGYPAMEIAGLRQISSGEVVQLRGRLESATDLANVRLFGFNAGLSRRPIILSAGLNGQLFLHGDGIKGGQIAVGFSTAAISALNNSRFEADFDQSVSAVVVPIFVNLKVEAGEFNFFVQNAELNRVYCIGCVKIQ